MACTTPLSSTRYQLLLPNPPTITTFTSSLHYPTQLQTIPCKKNILNLTSIKNKISKFHVNVRKTNEISESEIECIGTGTEVECVINEEKLERNKEELGSELGLLGNLFEWAVLISPFFFWGTAMVAMKEVLPKVGPFFVASFRLIPAGLLLIGYAGAKGRPLPSGFNAWFSISLFALVDASCFQVLLIH